MNDSKIKCDKCNKKFIDWEDFGMHIVNNKCEGRK